MSRCFQRFPVVRWLPGAHPSRSGAGVMTQPAEIAETAAAVDAAAR